MIYLSAGHSGNDSGAVANGTTEHDEVQSVVRDLKTRFWWSEDVAVVPFDLNLRQRIAYLNEHMRAGDVMIEFHMDAAGASAKGATMFVEAGDSESTDHAELILNKYCNYSGIISRGVKPDTSTSVGSLGILRYTPDNTKKMLLEMGFITNKSDLELVRDQAAGAIEQALIETYRLAEPIAEWADESAAEAKRLGVWVDQKNPLEPALTMKGTFYLFKIGLLTKIEQDDQGNDRPANIQELNHACYKAKIGPFSS